MIKKYSNIHHNPAWVRPSARVTLKQCTEGEGKVYQVKKKKNQLAVGDFSIQRDSKSIKTHELYERAQNSESILSSLL